MNQRRFVCVLLALAVNLSSACNAQAAKPWELLIPFKRVDADQEKTYELTEEDGPWMILAASFAGPGAKQQAQQLVYELRKEFKMEAFIHKQTYDFSKPVVGLGINRYGGPKVMRHANASKFDELAVLVGDFKGVNDPAIDKALEKLKHAHPGCLDLKKQENSTQRFVGLRELYHRLASNGEQGQGPMRNAFVTRNPLLPKEYFVPAGLDPLVEEMNRGVKYCLLDNKSRFSVRVATFRGSSTMKLDQIKTNGKDLPSKLEEAAIKAHDLTMALRKRGVEAYEFHDRYESIVTIGSFDSVGTPRPDGKTELDPRIHQIMKTYGPDQQQLPGQNALGLIPNSLNGISFDVQPIPVEVPQRSIATAYAPSNRLFE